MELITKPICFSWPSMDVLHTQQTGESRHSKQRTCENCGEYVTKQFVRVFGANDGSVYGCMNCSTGRDLRDGGASEPSR